MTPIDMDELIEDADQLQGLERAATFVAIRMKQRCDLQRSDSSNWSANQLCNVDNTAAHRDGTGAEILDQMDGSIDGWVASVGPVPCESTSSIDRFAHCENWPTIKRCTMTRLDLASMHLHRGTAASLVAGRRVRMRFSRRRAITGSQRGIGRLSAPSNTPGTISPTLSGVAQLAEQRTVNPLVESSSLSPGAMYRLVK